MATIRESNLFGNETAGITSTPTEAASSETTAAGKLIDHLKYVADAAVVNAGNRADWLGIASSAGQNKDADSIANRQLKPPTAISRSSAFTGFTLPNIGTSTISLPAVPDNLKIDFATIASDVQADLEKLKNSWMATYLPSVTDITKLDTVLKDVLGATDDSSVKSTLASLENELASALSTVMGSAKQTLDERIATVASDLDSRYTTAASGISSATTAASSNAQVIGWNRQRDAAAREAARLEAEATSDWASRGFSLPGGALTAASRRQRQATLNQVSDFAAQRAEKMQQVFIDLGKLTADAYLRQMDAQANASIQAYRAVLDHTLRYSELKLDADKSKVKQALDHLQLRLDFTKTAAALAVQYRVQIMEAIDALVRAYAALRANEAQYQETIAGAQRQAQLAYLEYYRAALAQAELSMKVDVTNNDNDVRFSGIAGSFIGQAVGNYVHAASASADVFARIAGMALSGLNGIASVAASA